MPEKLNGEECNNNSIKFYFLYISALLVIGIAWIVSHDVAHSLNPWVATFMRVLGVFAGLVVLNLLNGVVSKKKILHIKAKRRFILQTLVLGSLGFCVYFWTSFMALEKLTPSEVGVAMTLIPSVGYILAVLMSMDDFVIKKFVGLLLGTSASIGYIILNSDGVSFQNFMGLLLVLISVVSYALYGLLYGKWFRDQQVFYILMIITLMGTLATSPFLIAEIINSEESYSIEIELITGFLLGLFFTLPVFIIYQKIIQLRGVLAANSIGIMTPFAVLLAELAFYSNNSVSLIQVLMLAVCSVSVWLVISPSKKVNI